MDADATADLYEIRIRGVLSNRLLVAFPGLNADTRAGETVLSGALPDQAALYGVLAQIEALGLKLLEVRYAPSRPDQVPGLLRERLRHLAMEDAQAAAARELMHKRGLPRLLWVEEYRDRIRAAEIDYVRALVRDIESGTLEGADWWRQVHERGFGRVPPPFPPDDSPGQGE